MIGTFSQLRIHLFFAVEGENNLIPRKHREAVEKYMTGVIQNRGHKLLAIYCMPDHVHVLIGWHTDQGLPNLMETIKKTSRKYINSKAWMLHDFKWQRGYGAFSYSKRDTDWLVRYILNQEEHHKKWTFKEEYIDLLTKFEVEFEERDLFDFYEYDMEDC